MKSYLNCFIKRRGDENTIHFVVQRFHLYNSCRMSRKRPKKEDVSLSNILYFEGFVDDIIKEKTLILTDNLEIP